MGETGTVTTFKVMIIAMLFYSFCITLISYAIPADARMYVTSFSEATDNIGMEEIGTQVEETMTRQTDIPVIEVGALVFYSGNILLDLLLNFAYAIPQMFGLLLHGLMILFNVDTYIWAVMQLFASVVITALYLIGLIQLLTGVRSGRLIS